MSWNNREEIKAYAKERGVKLTEVAKELGISKQRLNAILHRRLNTVTVAAIVSAIDRISERKIKEGKLG